MKTIKVIIITIITFISLSILNTTRAAIENKPKGTLYSNISVSDSYRLCYDLRNNDETSTLGNNSLNPHLTTNADWGAAAYLGVSIYGSVRSATGEQITIDGIRYYTTTGNVTGIMNMGKNYTQTASLWEGNSTEYTENLRNNINTKYVENLPNSSNDENNKGKSFFETSGWYGSSYFYPNNSSYPVGVRILVMGFLRQQPSHLQRWYRWRQ